MRIKTAENGNVAVQHRTDNVSHNNPVQTKVLNKVEDTTNRLQAVNCNTLYNARSALVIENYSDEIGNLPENTLSLVAELICNRQYRINSRNVNTETFSNLPLEIPVTDLPESNDIIGTTNVCENSAPINEEKKFEHSDTDEMSENGIQTVPRGIVNPNYPGFQHLAHTLQDYSSSIENFYQSENEMTDDDVDIEITDLAYEADPIKSIIYNDCELNNNNNTQKCLTKEGVVSSENESYTETYALGNQLHNDIPDLLKTISKSNNNNERFLTYDIDCSDTDIENNFHTKDIIGDFNKEIEDEIKQLLNYNINIQDDLEELCKDIKDTFSKPIENTINNISDVVNHVIKKLVETNIDGYDEEVKENNINKQKSEEKKINEINKQNERNTQTEMNLSRPTFLLIDHDSSGKIADAFLSDGKDEINIEDYDPEKLSLSVENTIKQLSTELRKIIPKLDEMRQRDRLWAECRNDIFFRDGNSNEVSNLQLTSPNTCFDVKVHQSITPSQSIRRSDPKIGKPDTRNTQNDYKEARLKKSDTTSKDCSRTAQGQHNISVRKSDSELECFDVYNIETALPKLDIDAIENHLKAAKEAERRKRNDREEIRRRLAMGGETEEYYSMGYNDRPGKKPSLHSRLQNGMNLQICFMNETASDNESQASDLDKSFSSTKSLSRSSLLSKSSYNHPYQTRPLSVSITKHDKISTVQSGAKLRPSSLTLKSTKSRSTHSLGHIEIKESDFYVLQATLQTEARMALAQAKEMARIQMERERRGRPASPVTEMLRRSMLKANTPLAPDRRRVSRQILTDMNIAQLQVIVNELHSQIEGLNDSLVKLLMARDELHMGQDSMLVDIEDLTRYLGVKEQTKKTKGTTNKSGMKRLTSLVHK